MSLNKGRLNPLGVLDCRRLNFIPGHFSKMQIQKNIDVKYLDHWINYNLNSRYAIVKNLSLDANKRMIEVIEIGLEDPREMTMLSLGFPNLH